MDISNHSNFSLFTGAIIFLIIIISIPYLIFNYRRGISSFFKDYFHPETASSSAQVVGVVCSIINLIAFFLLPFFQIIVFKVALYDVADNMGGICLSLWLAPIAASAYLLLFFLKRKSVSTLLIRSIGLSYVIAVVLIIIQVIASANNIHSNSYDNNKIDFEDILGDSDNVSGVSDMLKIFGIGFYALFISSLTTLVFPSRGNPNQDKTTYPQTMYRSQLENNNVLTLPEIAERLKITPAEVTALVESGKLKGTKIGEQWRVKETTLNDFING